MRPSSGWVSASSRVESPQSGRPHALFRRASPLGSDGIPYVFDWFWLAGVTDEAALDEAIEEGAASLPSRDGLSTVRHENELPLDNTIVDFPSK